MVSLFFILRGDILRLLPPTVVCRLLHSEHIDLFYSRLFYISMRGAFTHGMNNLRGMQHKFVCPLQSCMSCHWMPDWWIWQNPGQPHAVLSPHTKILAHLAGSVHFLSIPLLPFGLLHNSGLVIPFHCAHLLQAAILLSHGASVFTWKSHFLPWKSHGHTTLLFYPILFSHCWSMVVVIHWGLFHCYSPFVRCDINICALFDFVGYDKCSSFG